MSHRRLSIRQPFQVLTSWLVFVGVCGNISSEEKNSTASSGTFCTDILSNGRESAHTRDQDRNARGPEMAQVQSSSPKSRDLHPPLYC